MERGLGLADFSVSANCIFNDAANNCFDVFKATTGTRTVNLVHSGQTLANECLVSDVGFGRASDGNFTISGTLSLQSGTVPSWS